MSKKKPIPLEETALIRAFNLIQVFEPTPLLHTWFDTAETLDATEQKLLEKACNNLRENANYWNEEELKMHFISILVFIADFAKPLRVYFDREISATINSFWIRTEADMLVSKGIGDLIETPYFFLHEYKREKKYIGDPIGQMLGGMLIAQAQNNDDKPVFGCYVQGRFWFFSILEGKEYIVSQPLNSVEIKEAQQIVGMLKGVKQFFQI